MSFNLFIDCANSVTLIITDDKFNLLASTQQAIDRASEKIHTIITDLFESINAKPLLVENVFVTKGPASFTSVRVGLTIAEGIKQAIESYDSTKKCNVFGINLLELMLFCNKNAKYAVSMPQKDSIFYQEQNSNIPKVCTVDDFIEIYNLNQGIVCGYNLDFIPGFDNVTLAQKLGENPVNIDSFIEFSNLILKKIDKSDYGLTPIYLKELTFKKTNGTI